ncbi:MAG: CDP-alcohol phosphatidyltransferase family protein [Myxococcota bacterium]
MAARLPPFSTLLKSRDVEDPINLWVHRPLAYAFVWATIRTPLTPNAITVLAMLVGIASGVAFLVGTPEMMVLGGALLWTAAILDGADGIMARAKNMASQLGRALDGLADVVVAVATVLPAFYHVWVKDHDVVDLAIMLPTLAFTLPHLALYDFYKESYLRGTRLDRGGEGDDPEKVRKLAADTKDKGFIKSFAVSQILLPMVTNQAMLVSKLNPGALREGVEWPKSEASAAIYRRHNRVPMFLWAMISLAPHSYLTAIFAMIDRLDIYLWIRLLGMNAIFLLAIVWQRIGTQRTLAAWAELTAGAPSPEARV